MCTDPKCLHLGLYGPFETWDFSCKISSTKTFDFILESKTVFKEVTSVFSGKTRIILSEEISDVTAVIHKNLKELKTAFSLNCGFAIL